MAGERIQLIEDLLKDPTNPQVVNALVAPDATYVSLNFDNPELKKIMPWAGTATGPQAVADTYARVGRYWEALELKVTDRFESEEGAAVFGSFTYKSRTLGKVVTSPFSIFVRTAKGKIVYMQFMEDTFGTASTFKAGGAWKIQSDPDGGEIQV